MQSFHKKNFILVMNNQYNEIIDRNIDLNSYTDDRNHHSIPFSRECLLIVSFRNQWMLYFLNHSLFLSLYHKILKKIP